VSVLRAMPWIVVAAPLLIAAVLAVGLRFWGRLAPWIALAGPLLAVAVGASSLDGGAAGSLTWLKVGDRVMRLGYRVDGLAAIMLLVVGVVASCVIVFSIGYMHGERGYVRYFAVISLFTAAMAGLVVATDLVGLFIGWELVGACSFLLIGFWYEKPSAAEAARKAFLVTRVGDAAMLLGMAVLWNATGTLELDTILGSVGSLAPAVATLAAVCLLMGAVGKSAQFPLHIWLPDAMEGPTPVSALIHAATMVAAGVFLVARTWPLFEASPTARMVALVLGTLTALGAAKVALTQTDIKKVLAYSTISQLGFMFAALGVGAWPVAIFHLVTHAAFKALLFLTAGSVIHGSGTQDLREMGGLRVSMPLTAAAWMVGGLALAGIPPLAGFFSKDAVVASVFHAAPWSGVALMVASGFTGAYVARATRLAFFGTPRGAAAHESPLTMTLPLAVLACAAAGLGFAGPAIAHALGAAEDPLALGLAAAAVGIASAGAVGGWLLAADGGAAESRMSPFWSLVWQAPRAGYRFDDVVAAVVIRPLTAVSVFTDTVVDRVAIDGVVEGLASLARDLGAGLADTMDGDGQGYARLLAGGAIVLLVVTILVVR